MSQDEAGQDEANQLTQTPEDTEENQQQPKLHVVTGAFGFTGRQIAHALLAQGHTVRTLTDRVNPTDHFDGAVKTQPYNFQRPHLLAQSLEGADTLFNTYWVRSANNITWGEAVKNSQALVQAARDARVRRLVHISVTNPSINSPLPYFRGKALVEEAIHHSGLSYAILRPALTFGDGDTLINNLAWILKRSPIFTVPGSGKYRIQPIFVNDLARCAVRAGAQDDNIVTDCVGPTTYSFDDLLDLIAQVLRKKTRFVHLPPAAALLCSKTIGALVRDTTVTQDEMSALTGNLLASETPPAGDVTLDWWLAENKITLGMSYAKGAHRRPRR